MLVRKFVQLILRLMFHTVFCCGAAKTSIFAHILAQFMVELDRRIFECSHDSGGYGAGKWFAGCYALYSGLFVVVVAAIVLAPVVHRLLHKFHYDAD